MDTFANSANPDEMPQNAAFYQDIHCLVRQNRSSKKEIQSCFEIITCHTSVNTMTILT